MPHRSSQKAILAIFATLSAHSAFGQTVGPNIDMRWHRMYAAGPFSAVSTAYGGLETAIPLIDLKCRGGMHLSFSINHRSNQSGGSSQLFLGPGSIARGWFSNVESTLTSNNGDVVQYVAGNGAGHWGATSPFGATDYVRYPGVRAEITRYGTYNYATGFDVRYPDKSVWSYMYQIGTAPFFKLSSIHDGHGNMTNTSGRSGSGWSVADQRAYDVWGSVRSGNTTGDPKHRYCASLGHPTDDESSLIYMRARNYESWTGRFISEDLQQDGLNYFVYCKNMPTSLRDFSGQEGEGGAAGQGMAASISMMFGNYMVQGATWITGLYGRLFTLAIAWLSRTNIPTSLPKFIEELEALTRSSGCSEVEIQWTSQTPKGAEWCQHLIELLAEKEGFHIQSDGLITQVYWLLETMID